MTSFVALAIDWLTPLAAALFVVGVVAHLWLTRLLDRAEVKRKTGNAWFWYVGHPLAPRDLYRRPAWPLWRVRDGCLKGFGLVAVALGVFRAIALWQGVP